MKFVTFVDDAYEANEINIIPISRKTNTTTHEAVGVMTKGDTQICFFDTPWLMLNCGGFPYRDVKARVESAWSSVNLYEVLIVIFDVHRHITRLKVYFNRGIVLNFSTYFLFD
ncbi:hypothetical protein RJT34_07451 [Clitoria ternatea]|uniref:Uncharacterized protein n=1 Tax=Clitoria ternatea TaxID=43366 RepID=A0AAN9PS82_CLITE